MIKCHGVTVRSLYSQVLEGNNGEKAALEARPEDTHRRWLGKLFHIRVAATGKARSPTIDRRVRPTISDGDEAEKKLPQYMTVPQTKEDNSVYKHSDKTVTLHVSVAYFPTV